MKQTANAAPSVGVRSAVTVLMAALCVMAALALSAGFRVGTAHAASTSLTTSAQAGFVAVADGVYVLDNRGKCLEVAGGSTADNAVMRLYTKNMTPAQRWRIEAVGGGWYRIVSVASGKSLTVNGKAKSGAAVIQKEWAGKKAQKWRFKADAYGNCAIVSALSSRYVLGTQGAKKTNGTRINLYAASGGKSQSWKLSAITPALPNGYYTLSNAGSKKMLEVCCGSYSKGANVWQYTESGELAQVFRLVYSEETGYYTILCAASGKALDVAYGLTYDGVNVQQYTPNGKPVQMWALTKGSDGKIIIRSAINGKALDIADASTADGANVHLWKTNGTKSQKWIAEAKENWIPDGTYYIANAKNPSYVLDVKNASKAKGANIQLCSMNGGAAQHFIIKSAGNGAYTIQNASSKLYADAAKAKSGANVSQTASKELWIPDLTENGILFRLKNKKSVVLESRANKPADGVNARVAGNKKTLKQKWLLVKTVEPGTVRYDNLSISISDMVSWFGYSYAVIDPSDNPDYDFIDLSKPTATTAGQLDAYISKYGSDGALAGQGAAFYGAAKKYGINQDYLLAHAISESGWGTSKLSGFSYGDKTYYNFFGIGAYGDYSVAYSVAINNDWSSPSKAIYGGAEWIAENYIYRDDYPMYSLYAMKWDYLYCDATKSYSWRRYAWGDAWTDLLGDLMTEIYESAGTGDSLSYVYPVYR